MFFKHCSVRTKKLQKKFNEGEKIKKNNSLRLNYKYLID